jgi:hypothetical protein
VEEREISKKQSYVWGKEMNINTEFCVPNVIIITEYPVEKGEIRLFSPSIIRSKVRQLERQL